MFGIQPIHIVIIIIMAFLIFGASRMPEIGRSLGRSISEFRKGTKEAAEGFKEEVAKTNEALTTPTEVSPQVPAQVLSETPAKSSAPTGNFCVQCGAPNPAEARFCNSCGAKLPEKAL